MAGTGKIESTGIPKNAGDSGTYFRDLVRSGADSAVGSGGDKSLMFQKCTNNLLGWDMDECGVSPGAIAPSFGSFEQVTADANT